MLVTKGARYLLSDSEKDALLDEPAALIAAQAARISELEARLSAPKKTSKKSHLPLSSGTKANRPGKGGKKKPRPSRPGTSRRRCRVSYSWWGSLESFTLREARGGSPRWQRCSPTAPA